MLGQIFERFPRSFLGERLGVGDFVRNRRFHLADIDII
jgi:hypothetical protein